MRLMKSQYHVIIMPTKIIKDLLRDRKILIKSVLVLKISGIFQMYFFFGEYWTMTPTFINGVFENFDFQTTLFF